MDIALGVGYSHSHFAHSLCDAWLYINQVRQQGGLHYETMEKASSRDVDRRFTGWLPGYDGENRRAKC